MMDRGEKRETKDLRRRSECYTMRQKMADLDRGGIEETSPRMDLMPSRHGLHVSGVSPLMEATLRIRCFTRNCCMDHWVGLMNEIC